MPWQEVMGKYKRGELHSGSKKGPVVRDRDQAVAIMLSEKRKGTHGRSARDGAKALARRRNPHV